jgi:hypothetical protein
MADQAFDLSDEELAELLKQRDDKEEEDKIVAPAAVPVTEFIAPEIKPAEGEAAFDLDPIEVAAEVAAGEGRDIDAVAAFESVGQDVDSLFDMGNLFELTEETPDIAETIHTRQATGQGGLPMLFGLDASYLNDIGDVIEGFVDNVDKEGFWSAASYGVGNGTLAVAEFGDGWDTAIREFLGQEPRDPSRMTQREIAEGLINVVAQSHDAARDSDDYTTDDVAERVMFNLGRMAVAAPVAVLTRHPATIIGMATAVDLVIFDADEPRMSDLYAKHLGETVEGLLTHDPADPFWMNKARQAFDAFLVNAAALGLLKSAKVVVKDIKVIMDRKRLANLIEDEKDLATRAARLPFEPQVKVNEDLTFAMPMDVRANINLKIADMVLKSDGTPGTTEALLRDLRIHMAMRAVKEADSDALLAIAKKQFEAAAKLSPKKRAALAPGPGDASKVEAVFDASTTAADAQLHFTPKQLLQFLDRAVTDTAGPIKSQLRKAGMFGEKAASSFEIMAGATALAKNTAKRYRAAVYGNLFNNRLHRGERAELDRLLLYDNMTMLLSKHEVVNTVEAMRLIKNLSDADKALLKTMTKNQKNISQLDIIDGIAAVHKRLGPERSLIVAQRQKTFQGAMVAELRKLREAGLISEDELIKLSRLQHTPMRYLESGDVGIDPMIKITQGKATLNVTSSGIKPLTHGIRTLIHTDSQLLMDQIVMRVAGRIARNKANQGLIELADEVPFNGIVSRAPLKNAQSTKLTAMVDGKPQEVYMLSEYAGQWIAHSASGVAEMKAVISVISGASAMRMMATGINPAFAVVQLGLDLQYQWLTTAAWSAFPPKAILQIGRNLKYVTSDAILRKGRYQDYIDEGGYFSFAMRHGATANEITVLGTIADRGLGSVAATKGARKVKNAFDASTDALGYFGATSEMMTRLAFREQVIMRLMKAEGLTYDPLVQAPLKIRRVATAEARAVIDFSQGGWLTKSIDSIAPYLNVSVLAFRNLIKGTVKNPQRVAAAMTGIWAGSASLYLYNRNVHPECWKSVSKRDKANNWIICTGATVQQDGETRHVYSTVPKDKITGTVASVVEGLLGKAFDDENPDEAFFEAAKGLSSLIGDAWGLLPPTLRAYIEYTQNISLFTDKSLWPYNPMHDPAKEILIKPKRPTPPLAIAVGEAIDASPARLLAIDSMFPRNLYRDALMNGFALLDSGRPTYDFTEAMRHGGALSLSSAVPIWNRYLKLTYPGGPELEASEDVVGPENDARFQENQAADEVYSNTVIPPEGTTKRGNLRAERRYIQGITDPNTRKRVGERIARSRALDRVFNRLTGKPGSAKQELKDSVPAQSWWLRLMGEDPKARAQLFMYEYRNTNSKRAKRLMDRINRQLHPNSDTYFSYVRRARDQN